MNHAQVIVDSRESRSKVPKILEKNLNVSYKTLLEGDYQVSDSIIFERKSYSDFCHSIKDGRLFKQAKRLKENFDKPIIILEGGPTYGGKQQKGYLPRDVVLGASLSVIDIGVSIVPTLSQADTARLIIRSVKRSDKSPTTYRVSSGKKATNCNEFRRQILECFPGVGAKTSERLAACDYPLIEMLNAFCDGQTELLTNKQLKKIQGILQKC